MLTRAFLSAGEQFRASGAGIDQAKAYAILSGPLVFGDTAQIAARQYLHHLAEVRERLMRCRNCQGVGVLVSRRQRRKRLCPCVALEAGEVLHDLGVSCPKRS